MIKFIAALKNESTIELEKMYNIEYSGIGKINATISAMKFKNMTHIINFGTAGGKPELVGKMVKCSTFYQRDLKYEEFYVPEIDLIENTPSYIHFPYEYNINLSDAICGTGDSFYTKGNYSLFDVVDMEAYAIAKVCYLYGINFVSFKYITDTGNHNASIDWVTNIKNVGIKFQELFQNIKL